MADLLNITRQISQKISYYEAIIDFADESHWFNPFYSQSEVMIIWSEIPDNNDFPY